MKQPGHIKGTPFQDGPLIAKASDLGSFAEWPENADRLRKLNKRLKLFRGEDGQDEGACQHGGPGEQPVTEPGLGPTFRHRLAWLRAC